MILFGIIVTQICNCERNVKKILCIDLQVQLISALVAIPDREQLCVCVCVYTSTDVMLDILHEVSPFY